MNFQKQANLHKPDEGIYGDCHRTCIAMLLDMDRDSVPNFGECYGDADAWNNAVRDFLLPLGVLELAHAFAPPLEKIIEFAQVVNPGISFVLAGTSRTGVNHSVIANHTGIIWDPSLTNAGIIGPCDDGYYWTYHYVRVPKC